MCISKIAFNMVFKKSNATFKPGKMTDMIMGPNFKLLLDTTAKNMPVYIDREKEIIPIKTFDGLTLNGDFFDNKGTDTFILVHGYNSSAECDFSNLTPFLLEKGFNVLCTNNRGGKNSDSDYITFGVYERLDTTLWIDEINKRYPSGNIYLMGVSLGGATVCCMSELELKNVRAIISDCAYISVRDEFSFMAQKFVHFVPKLLLNGLFKEFKKNFGLSADDITPLNAISNAKYPILFIHGKEDRFIPVSHVEKLYENCPTKKDLFIVENAGHAASYVNAKEEYEKRIISFIKSVK